MASTEVKVCFTGYKFARAYVSAASANFGKIAPNPTCASRHDVIDLLLIGISRALQLNCRIRMDMNPNSARKPFVARNTIYNRVRAVFEPTLLGQHFSQVCHWRARNA